MAISASQITTNNTLEQFRSEFNNLRDDVSGLESGTATFSAISATTLGSSSVNVQQSGAVVFEGASANAFESTLAVLDPTADRTITLPNQSGLVSLIGGIKTAADDDIVLDGTDATGLDADSRLLLEDVMDGDTGSFLSQHGVTFEDNTLIATTLSSAAFNVSEDGTIKFEGATDNTFETTLTVVDPTLDRTISFPNQTGLISLVGGVRTAADDDVVLDGTDSSSTDDGGRLLLEDVMDGDTISILSSHGVTFSSDTLNASAISSTSLSGTTINVLEDGSIVFEGATDDEFETTLNVLDPTADRTIIFPNQSGTVDLLDGIKTAAEDDIVLDGTDGSSTNAGSRLLLEDITDDTGSFLSQHGMTFSNNDTSISGKLTVSGGIDGNLLASGNFIFEGSTVDAFETTLTAIDPTVDRTISLPNQTGLIGLIGGVRTAADDDIVLDGTDSSGTGAGSRLLLEDVMDGDTGSFLSQHGLTFSNNDASISGKLSVAGGIDGNLLSSGNFIFEGSTVDAFETTLTAVDPTEDRTITFPNQTGIVDLVDGLKSGADEDIILDGTDSSSTDAGGRLLLQDAMQGDTGSFLAGHGITFADNDLQISAGIKLNGVTVIPSTTASALSTVDDATALAIALG